MRSVLYRRHGRPSEVLETVTVDDPTAPTAGHVLIRVLARPLHYGDILGIAGRYGDADVAEGGNRVGYEGYGRIASVGADVGLLPGTRVAFFPGPGAWSEQVVVPATFVTVVPDDLGDDIAAQLHVNPLTAALLRQSVKRAGIVPEADVVVLSAAGSAVAKLTIALLRDAGVDVIGIVRSRSGANELVKLVPGLSVVSTDGKGWQDELARAAAGKPIKAVLDPVGGVLASALIDALDDGGALVSYGDLSGDPITAPALAFSSRDIQIFGVSVGAWGGRPADQRNEDIRVALDLARRHPSLFPVAARYDLGEVGNAASHVERPGKTGVVLLTSY